MKYLYIFYLTDTKVMLKDKILGTDLNSSFYNLTLINLLI